MSDKEFDKKAKTAENPARRNMLLGSGALVAGGAIGHLATPPAAEAQSPQAAPELPWPWQTIDPMEAASRTYNAYLNQGG